MEKCTEDDARMSACLEERRKRAPFVVVRLSLQGVAGGLGVVSGAERESALPGLCQKDPWVLLGAPPSPTPIPFQPLPCLQPGWWESLLSRQGMQVGLGGEYIWERVEKKTL